MLAMLPAAADPAEVDVLIESIATSFEASEASPVTRSVGPLMGPGAQAGAAGWILEADFVSLEAAMTAIHAGHFQDVKAKTEALGTTLFLFEIQDV